MRGALPFCLARKEAKERLKSAGANAPDPLIPAELLEVPCGGLLPLRPFGPAGPLRRGSGGGPLRQAVPFPPQGIQIRRRHPIRPTSRRERAKPPTLAAAKPLPPHSQPPNQALSHQGRHLSWRQGALQPKRTGRRQRVRNTATDAFGRPGPGRSPGRSLPSFCRHRKKGPAGEAVEEMT